MTVTKRDKSWTKEGEEGECSIQLCYYVSVKTLTRKFSNVNFFFSPASKKKIYSRHQKSLDRSCFPVTVFSAENGQH